MHRTSLSVLAAAVACCAAAPDAVFRNSSNQIVVSTYAGGTVTAPNPPPDPVTGGVVTLSGDPSTLQDSTGSVYVLVRDGTGKFWFNRYTTGSGWLSWSWTGGIGQGKPAMAFGADGGAYFAIRGNDNRYWLARRTAAGQVQGWYLLGPNQFPIDPAMVGPGDGGVLYLVGGDAASLSRTYFSPNSNFLSSTWQGSWTPMGGNSLSGTPALALGSDGRAYLLYRWPLDGSGYQGTTWMFKFSTASAEGWYLAPSYLGPMAGQPSAVVSPADNRVYVLGRRPSDNLYFWIWASLGTGNTWYSYWTNTNRSLDDADLGVDIDGIYVAGRGGDGSLWWLRQSAFGNGWLLSAGGATGRIATTPDFLSASNQNTLTITQPNPPPVVYADSSSQSFTYPAQNGHLASSCRLTGPSTESIEITNKTPTQLSLRIAPDPATPTGRRSFVCYRVITFEESNPGTIDIADRSPLISSVAVQPIQAGSSYPISIDGQYFGANPSLDSSQLTISASGTSVSITSWTHNLIQATVSSPPSTSGYHTLEVTSRGAGGTSFYLAPSSPPASSRAQMQILFQAALPPPVSVTIRRDGSPVTGSGVSVPSRTVMVGQKINLTGEVGNLPAGVSVTGHTWTIPDKAVGGYSQTTTSGSVTAYSAPNSAATSFYWVSGGSKAVSYRAQLSNGIQVTGSATIEVHRPSATLTGLTTGMSPAVRFEFGDIQPGPSMNFGATPPPSGGATPCRNAPGQVILPGICFSVSWNIPVNPVGFPPNSNFGAGEIAFLQTVKTLRRNTLDSGQTTETNSGTSYWLDHQAGQPTLFYSDVKYDVSSGDQAAEQELVYDFPNAEVHADDRSVHVEDSYRMYPIYRPSGADSIWVTLRLVPWSWSGLLTRLGGTWASEVPTSIPGVQPWYSTTPASVDPVASPYTADEPDGLPRWSGSTP